MTKHVMTAELEVPCGTNLDDITYEYPTVRIEFNYVGGAAASWDAEVELISATLVGANELGLSERRVHELADDYLNTDAGYHDACEEAVTDIRQRRAEARGYEGRI